MKQISGLSITRIVLIAATLASCSNTPNSVTIRPNQNQCVQANMYSSGVTPSPLILGNPLNAPYCMSVTIQNNNSGVNANNIQVTQNGLSMSYTVGTNPTLTSQMYDPAAAGITISGANQVLGNIAVFDPSNCLTSSGANVVTINSGGITCTFYMQILGESNPVGVYATNLNYNYTNGNQNYAVATNVNQRVNLYAGGTTGLFVDNTGAWISGASLPVPISIPTTVTSLARDLYGNIYIATPQLVYLFNGTSTNQVANAIPGVQINGITTDLNASVYIATNQGIFKFNPDESSAVWVPYNDLSSPPQILSNTNMVSIKGYENFESTNTLYATTESQAYICNTQADLNGQLGCHWSLLNTGTPPNTFLPNALAVDFYNNLYTANKNQVNTYTTSWQNINYFSQPGATTGTLGTVFWTLLNNTQYLYVGENNTFNPSENVVYVCNPSPTGCGPILSSNSNTLTGNVYAVAADGNNNVYAVGSGINSADFSSTPNVFGAFLSASPTGFVESTPWTPISNGSPAVISGGSLTVLKVSSMLTSY